MLFLSFLCIRILVIRVGVVVGVVVVRGVVVGADVGLVVSVDFIKALQESMKVFMTTGWRPAT